VSQLPDIAQTVKATLSSHGFNIAERLQLSDAHFDLVAEDNTRLVFVVFRSDNTGWVDEFRRRQASLAESLSVVNLGKKWRDVYLVEFTSDPIDTDTELLMTESITSDTLVARKLIVDASLLDPNDPVTVEHALRSILPAVVLPSVTSNVDVLKSLRDHLLKSGIPDVLVTGVISRFTSGSQSIWELVLENTP
jgi:hypothetical protein